MVFARRFIIARCKVSTRKAYEARGKLTEVGIIHICGKGDGRTCVYLSGPHFKHPAYQSRKCVDGGEGRLLEHARRIAWTLCIKGDPAGFDLPGLEELRQKARSDGRRTPPTGSCSAAGIGKGRGTPNAAAVNSKPGVE